MAEAKDTWTDKRVELIVGNILRAGVILSALVVLAGGIVYLIRHGTEEVSGHRQFNEESEPLRTLPKILAAAAMLQSRGLIQLGLVLLIATPVVRVIFTVFAFLLERDYTYVVVTLIVLAVLLYSLFGAHP